MLAWSGGCGRREREEKREEGSRKRKKREAGREEKKEGRGRGKRNKELKPVLLSPNIPT